MYFRLLRYFGVFLDHWRIFVWLLWMNNSTTEHDTTNQLHHFTQNQPYILTISVFRIMKKYPKLVKNPLKDLAFHQNFAAFAMSSNHQEIYISRLAVLSWTEWYKRFCHSMYGCWDIECVSSSIAVRHVNGYHHNTFVLLSHVTSLCWPVGVTGTF